MVWLRRKEVTHDIIKGSEMNLLIIPITQIYRGLRRGAAKLLGEKEVRSLENDAVNFVNEVYDDTVGDVMKKVRK